MWRLVLCGSFLWLVLHNQPGHSIEPPGLFKPNWEHSAAGFSLVSVVSSVYETLHIKNIQNPISNITGYEDPGKNAFITTTLFGVGKDTVYDTYWGKGMDVGDIAFWISAAYLSHKIDVLFPLRIRVHQHDSIQCLLYGVTITF